MVAVHFHIIIAATNTTKILSHAPHSFLYIIVRRVNNYCCLQLLFFCHFSYYCQAGLFFSLFSFKKRTGRSTNNNQHHAPPTTTVSCNFGSIPANNTLLTHTTTHYDGMITGQHHNNCNHRPIQFSILPISPRAHHSITGRQGSRKHN